MQPRQINAPPDDDLEKIVRTLLVHPLENKELTAMPKKGQLYNSHQKCHCKPPEIRPRDYAQGAIAPALGMPLIAHVDADLASCAKVGRHRARNENGQSLDRQVDAIPIDYLLKDVQFLHDQPHQVIP